MKKMFRRSRVILVWLFSYVAILIITLSINLIATFRMAASLREEAYHNSAALLQQLRTNVEMHLDDITKLAEQIETNSNIERFLKDLSQIDYPADEFNRIMVDLRSYQSSNHLIEQIYIIPHSSNIAISSGAVLRDSQFDGLIDTYSGASEDEALELQGDDYFNRFTLFHTQNGFSNDTITIGYLKTLTKRIGSRYDATLLLLFKPSSLLSNLDMGGDMESRFYIINGQSEIVVSSGSLPLPEAIDYALLTGQESRFPLEYENERYTVMQMDSHGIDWKYLMLIPDSVLFHDFHALQRLMWFTTIVAILVGIAFSVILSRKNYLPLHDLVSTMENETGRVFSRQQNEFYFIREATRNISIERQELQTRLRNQITDLRQLFFIRLIQNKLPETLSMQEASRMYDIHFVSNRFLVMVICYSSESPLNSPEMHREKQTQKRLIHEAFEYSVNLDDYGFVIEIDDVQAVIYNLSADGRYIDADCDRAFEVVEKTLGQLEKQGVCDLIVASSDCVYQISDLPKAYIDAYTTAEYCIMMNRTGLNHYKYIEYGMSSDGSLYYYYYPLQAEMQLTNAIKSGDQQQASYVLDGLFRMNFEECSIPREIARCFMFNLTSTIIRVIYELNPTGPSKLESNVSAIESLLNCRSIPEIRRELDQVLVKLTDYAREQQAQNSFSADIRSYIEANYSDMCLDLPQIAGHFGLTPSYLSKKFKASMGIGLLDYINKFRVTKASEMLKATPESIQSIAVKCGFLNSNTFIRVFKKYEGITPGKFREISGT